MPLPLQFLKKISVSLLLLIFAALCTPLRAAGHRSPSVRVDQDYIAALAAANRFLSAWQNQDRETAILLLTDKLKQHTKEERLDTFFSPSTHTQQAYEISSGKKLRQGCYIFRVALFNSGQPKSAHPHSSQLVVIRSGKNDWAIDKIP